MAIALSALGAASNGPNPSPDARPNLLSVGDSLMWGQGLRPDHRFRELVRARLARAFGSVVELSMARAGAPLDPSNPQNDGTSRAHDVAIAKTLLENPPPDPIYSPGGFAREVPHDSLSTAKQLEVARDLLRADGDADPADIRWIILDGGINDVDVRNIVTPAGVFADGDVLAGWAAWLLDRARTEVEPQMVTTLANALDFFPNALIVVNGYFPIFSSQSMFSTARVASFGALHAGLTTLLANPASLMKMAEASRVWQIVSNKHLRLAIERVRRQFPGRTVVFARSNIEDSHCLFAPNAWLWGYSAIPPTVPATVNEWIQWLAGATPEDEVIVERLARCRALRPSGLEGDTCRLASIGHPNVRGAVDYATSITDAMEDAGVIASDLGACALQERRRYKTCVEDQDDWDYRCVVNNVRMVQTCNRLIRGLPDTVRSQAKDVVGNLSRAGDHMRAAGDCLTNAVGSMVDAAQGAFIAAANDIAEAGNRVNDAMRCWNESAAELRRCEDAQAQAIAACDAAYAASLNGACSIWCNSFGNCNSYSRFNPYRYVCRGLRAACVGAAAVARGACASGVLVVHEGCRAEALAEAILCKAGVVVGDAVCSLGNGIRALGDVALAGARGLYGVGTASAAFADGTACAAGEVGRAGIDVAIAGGRLGIDVAWDLGVIGAYAGCRSGQWFLNKLCRLTASGANTLCRAVSGALDGACRVAASLSVNTGG